MTHVSTNTSLNIKSDKTFQRRCKENLRTNMSISCSRQIEIFKNVGALDLRQTFTYKVVGSKNCNQFGWHRLEQL